MLGMKMKYNSLEELNKHREKLDKEYDEGLPDYLREFFDQTANKLKKDEFFAEKRKLKYTSSNEEKKEYFEQQNKEFWENNDFQLIKRKRTHSAPVYVEPPRNQQRIEDEKELTAEEIKLLVTMCEKDLYLFAIRYFSHYLRQPSSRFHKYLYTFLSDNTNNRKKHSRGFKHAIAAPRGNAKSSIISAIYPLWCIAYNKKNFIIIVSDTVGQAVDFLADIKREIDNNALLLRDFPHLSGKGPTWRNDEIITKNDIKVMALGTGSKIRGRRFGTRRPDLIIFDDIENTDMVRSESERTHIREEWFDKDAMHVAGEKGTFTDFLFVGTIIGKEALLPTWKGILFKSVYTFSTSPLWDEWGKLYKNRFDEDRIDTARKFFEESREEMLDGTEVLWPEGDPYYDLMIEKLSNPRSFESEKQNNPLDPSRIIITIDQLRFESFSHTDWIQRIIKNKRNPRYGALDPSLGKKAGDYSCICTLVRDLKTGFILVLGFSLKKRDVDAQIKAILEFHKDHRYKLFAVETNVFQLVVADNLRKASRKAGIYVPVKDVIVKTDKKMRFEAHFPVLNDGTVIFNSDKYKTSQQYNKSLYQISTFTGLDDGDDDAVDSLSLALSLVTKPAFKLRTKQNR
jgi:predicted phage terminase large subunit-like protein